MRRRVTYSIVDCPDGRFAVVAISASGTAYCRDGFLTLAEAETCAESLCTVMAVCGAPLMRRDGGPGRIPPYAPYRPNARPF
ncbi:hypothetical protein MHIMP23_06095 [Methylobacterium hispanicum]|jgi:hypothetical protein|uniref:Uncharacterized protein n=1 Tax=Methylobacterium hispanicum TaxID=270350 RepID=A0AAV4ZRK9_9HYPH|nr:hypothetical protein BHAOGJBA_4664 [Methylobacterium hispanicum]